MAYKIFAAPNGSNWEVWMVVPTEAERRRGERRGTKTTAGFLYRGPERRLGPDRRQTNGGTRTVVSAGFEKGWLCFESEEGEKRRLAPVPEGWEDAQDDKLWLWCSVATPVAKCGPRREEL
ncbi:MAG: hypothetical protein WD802_09135 [Gemmatimonadaceae bacterium]